MFRNVPYLFAFPLVLTRLPFYLLLVFSPSCQLVSRCRFIHWLDLTNIPIDEDARPSTQKLLLKWRPHILEETKPQPEPIPEAKSEARTRLPPSNTAAATNGVESPISNNIHPHVKGEVGSETNNSVGGLDIAGAGADTGGKTERGGSVVAAVG